MTPGHPPAGTRRLLSTITTSQCPAAEPPDAGYFGIKRWTED